MHKRTCVPEAAIKAWISNDILQNVPRPVSNPWQTFWFPALENKEGLGRHGLNVWRLMSVIVACLALTHKTEMHGKLVFDKTWCCQPHRMGRTAHQSKNGYGWTIMWDVIIYACLWYVFLAHKSSYHTRYITVTSAVVILHPLSWNASSHGLNGFRLICRSFPGFGAKVITVLAAKTSQWWVWLVKPV